MNIKKICTNTLQLNKAYLVNRRFSSLPFYMEMNLIEAEWFEEAIKKKYPFLNNVDCYIFENNFQNIIKKEIDISKKIFIEINRANYSSCIIITNPSFDFIYFKDLKSRYYIVSGESDFFNDFYRCSKKVAEKMYFEWADDFDITDSDKKLLKHIWKEYFF